MTAINHVLRLGDRYLDKIVKLPVNGLHIDLTAPLAADEVVEVKLPAEWVVCWCDRLDCNVWRLELVATQLRETATGEEVRR
ncbi:hypothetical protein OH492_08195 [Vibrio chagasii]|nr:hypothetical protein [Vibrio chagasii]